MTAQALVAELKSSREFFERSSRCLAEQDSQFRPAEGMYTVAQQVSHAAQTVDWFVDAATRPEGFDVDFERHIRQAMAVTSLTAAREWLNRAFDAAERYFGERTQQELDRLLPPGPIMGDTPIWALVSGIVEHTAHHRGALTVYSRMLGKTPPMPYGDM
jgi:uncharacterized damage-inducible protein DinB